MAKIIRNWLQNCLTATNLKVCVCVGWGERNGALPVQKGVCPMGPTWLFLVSMPDECWGASEWFRMYFVRLSLHATSSFVDRPTLNSERRAELCSSGGGLCLHWKMRIEVAVWTDTALLFSFAWVCTVVHVSKGVYPTGSIKTTSGIMVCPFCGASLCPLQLGQRSSGGYFGHIVLMFVISQQLWLDS